MKELSDMTLEELWELFPIELSEHRPEWREWAEEEMGCLSEVLSGFDTKVTHIGSTAIEGIAAKPIVDLLIEIPQEADWQGVCSALTQAGYICMASNGRRASFNKGYTPAGYAERVFHIHLREEGDNDEIFFRDYLREHPDVAQEYAALKRSLLPRFRNNRDGYTEAKTEFVCRITKHAKAISGTQAV